MQSCYGLVVAFMETPAIMGTWKVSFPDLKKKVKKSAVRPNGNKILPTEELLHWRRKDTAWKTLVCFRLTLTCEFTRVILWTSRKSCPGRAIYVVGIEPSCPPTYTRDCFVVQFILFSQSVSIFSLTMLAPLLYVLASLLVHDNGQSFVDTWPSYPYLFLPQTFGTKS